MGFTFEIMSISRLEKAGVAVLDGRLLEGSAAVEISAELIHDGKRIPIHLKGAVLGSAYPGAGVLSLTVDLREDAMGHASAGDLIVSASAPLVRYGTEKFLTKNGASYVALVDARKLEYFHALEAENARLVLVQGALDGLEDHTAGRVLDEAELDRALSARPCKEA